MTISERVDVEIALDPLEIWDRLCKAEKEDMKNLVFSHFKSSLDDLISEDNVSDLIYGLNEDNASLLVKWLKHYEKGGLK